VASNTREVAIRSGVDPEAEPSVDWGWHQNFTKGLPIAAGLTGVVLLLFLIGHPASWTEILYMAIPAVFCLVGAVVYPIYKRRSWRH
jgi:phosphatidylserine synthase